MEVRSICLKSMHGTGFSGFFRRLRPHRSGLLVAALGLGGASSVFAAEPAADRNTSRRDHRSETSVGSKLNTDMCVQSHTQSQVLRQQGKLMESRSALVSCSSATCPGVIRRDCARWVEEVQAQIPSVAFRASLAGEELTNVKVFVDGALIFERLEGKALELDPGVYQLRLVMPAPIQPVEQKLVMTQGEPLRIVSVEFSRPTGSVPPGNEARADTQTPTPLATYVLAGVGTAAAISGVAWTLSTLTGENELEASCAPGCPDEMIDIVRQRALLADISWGLSAASFITAAAFYFLRPEVAPSDATIDIALVEGGVLGAVQLRIP